MWQYEKIFKDVFSQARISISWEITEAHRALLNRCKTKLDLILRSECSTNTALNNIKKHWKCILFKTKEVLLFVSTIVQKKNNWKKMIKHQHYSHFYQDREIGVWQKQNKLDFRKRKSYSVGLLEDYWYAKWLVTAQATRWWTAWATSLNTMRLFPVWRFAQHKGSHMLHCVLKGSQSK